MLEESLRKTKRHARERRRKRTERGRRPRRVRRRSQRRKPRRRRRKLRRRRRRRRKMNRAVSLPAITTSITRTLAIIPILTLKVKTLSSFNDLVDDLKMSIVAMIIIVNKRYLLHLRLRNNLLLLCKHSPYVL